MGAQGQPPVVALAVLRGQPRAQGDRQAGGQRRDHAVKVELLRAHADAYRAIGCAGDGSHALSEAQVTSQLADPLGQAVVELLKAAAQVAQPGGTQVDARPEPRQRYVGVMVPKLALEEWLPLCLVAA